jgi:ketol-acid reductoisomerase
VSDRLAGARIAVVGFGNQGAAHAHNLRASGLEILVGARATGSAAGRARALGFAVFEPAEAMSRCSAAAMLLPDETLPELWPALGAALPAGAAVVFAHGFNLVYADLEFPTGSDVVLVSPTGPGSLLGRAREIGERLPAYLAVHRDESGGAWSLAEDYADRLFCGPLLRTTVREETEVDLFGEQAVLCGGMNALVLAAFETLVARGFTPEVAYLECVHQLRYLAELLNERGLDGLRRSISGTALYGDLTRGPRVIGEESRRAMAAILEEVRTGAFAREWQAEVASGRRRLRELLAAAADHPIERARKRVFTGPEPSPRGD